MRKLTMNGQDAVAGTAAAGGRSKLLPYGRMAKAAN
jgi:hypothetical protein